MMCSALYSWSPIAAPVLRDFETAVTLHISFVCYANAILLVVKDGRSKLLNLFKRYFEPCTFLPPKVFHAARMTFGRDDRRTFDDDR